MVVVLTIRIPATTCARIPAPYLCTYRVHHPNPFPILKVLCTVSGRVFQQVHPGGYGMSQHEPGRLVKYGGPRVHLQASVSSGGYRRRSVLEEEKFAKEVMIRGRCQWFLATIHSKLSVPLFFLFSLRRHVLQK